MQLTIEAATSSQTIQQVAEARIPGLASVPASPAGDAAVHDRANSLLHWPPPLSIPEDILDNFPGVPGEFICPITQGIMKQPAVTERGTSYDRAAIELWLQSRR